VILTGSCSKSGKAILFYLRVKIFYQLAQTYNINRNTSHLLVLMALCYFCASTPASLVPQHKAAGGLAVPMKSHPQDFDGTAFSFPFHPLCSRMTLFLPRQRRGLIGSLYFNGENGNRGLFKNPLHHGLHSRGFLLRCGKSKLRAPGGNS